MIIAFAVRVTNGSLFDNLFDGVKALALLLNDLLHCSELLTFENQIAGELLSNDLWVSLAAFCQYLYGFLNVRNIDIC